LQRQADQWRKQVAAERNRQEVSLRKEFLLEQYRHRLASYPGVFKTLGAVSDVSLGSNPQRYKELREDENVLPNAAEEIYTHLYSEPGLFMTMRTRNRLHVARRQCLAFLQSDGVWRLATPLSMPFSTRDGTCGLTLSCWITELLRTWSGSLSGSETTAERMSEFGSFRTIPSMSCRGMTGRYP
jgi:hypothetical protein